MKTTTRAQGGRMRRMVVLAAALSVVFGACSGGSGDDGDDADGATTTAATARSTEPAPATSEGSSLDIHTVAVGSDLHQLAWACRGVGEPTIVLEAGTDSGGIDSFPAAFVAPLAKDHQVCTYDRLGTGKDDRACTDTTPCSDDPTPDRRTIDDIVVDLHDLVTAAELPGPYLLMGNSGGGLIVARYALTHPEDVAGVVLLDAGVPNPAVAEEFPGEAAWNNVEHVDWPAAEILLSTLPATTGNFPVVVVAA
jgi:pimeloyl-ACP methyl ester carboxylesterase